MPAAAATTIACPGCFADVRYHKTDIRRTASAGQRYVTCSACHVRIAISSGARAPTHTLARGIVMPTARSTGALAGVYKRWRREVASTNTGRV